MGDSGGQTKQCDLHQVCIQRPNQEEWSIYQTRATMGGNLINYLEDVGTPTANLLLIKILLNSVIQFASVCNTWWMGIHQSQQRNVWLTSSRITRPWFFGTAIEQRGIFPTPDCASIMEAQNQINLVCASSQQLWDQIPKQGRLVSPHPIAWEVLRCQRQSRLERIRENTVRLG